jgi:hypothetical protein
MRAMVWLVSIAALLVIGRHDLSAQYVRQSGDSTYYTANPYLGTPLSTYDPRVSEYAADGALNPYTSGGGRLYSQDGTYLGRLNANEYNPESVSNPYGQYGSKYSPNSVNNPYSTYGSPYSAQSPTDPYTSTPPVVLYGDDAPAPGQ